MNSVSTKPYLVRAIYDWCCDSSLTPYLTIRVEEGDFSELKHYVKNGEVTLNISIKATPNINIGNEMVSCSARFNGVAQDLCFPVSAVSAIFAKENGQGMLFPAEEKSQKTSLSHPGPEKTKTLSKIPDRKSVGKPNLQIIK